MMFELVLAVTLGQPCLAHPVPHHVHHGIRIVPEPAQSCIVPPVPMCFRPPVEVPDEIFLPPLPYYTDSPPVAMTPDASGYAFWGNYGGGFGSVGGGFVEGASFGGGGSGGGGTVTQPTEPTHPPVDYPPAPPHGYLPPPRTKAQAPELGASSAASAMTLLLGCMVVLGSRKRM